MSHYDWPLSPIYELPLSSSASSFEPISEIPESYTPTSLSISLSICNARSTVLALLRRQDDEPRVTTAPKYRMKRAKDLLTLRRVMPLLTILLIILTLVTSLSDESRVSIGKSMGMGMRREVEWDSKGWMRW